MRELQPYEFEVVNGGTVDGDKLGANIGGIVDSALALFKIKTNFTKAGQTLGAGIQSISAGSVTDAVFGIGNGVVGLVSNGISVISQIFGRFNRK